MPYITAVSKSGLQANYQSVSLERYSAWGVVGGLGVAWSSEHYLSAAAIIVRPTKRSASMLGQC